MINIYTDGAYSPTRNQGGWAFIVVDDTSDKVIFELSDAVADTTNNRMEIEAVLRALLYIKFTNLESCKIYSDSLYVIGTICDGWKRNKNQDLWEVFDKLKQPGVKYIHVKGHDGNKFNERCDELAVFASHLNIN